MYKILIVEDSMLSQGIIKEQLTGLYDLSFVRSGGDALDYLSTRKVNMVLMDYQMPGMNGLETLKAMRHLETSVDTPVMFLTSRSDEDTVLECLSAGAIGYIIKPISRAMLLRKISSYFEEKSRLGLKKVPSLY